MALGEGDRRGLAVAFPPRGFVLASGGRARGVFVSGRIPWDQVALYLVRQLDDGHGEGILATAFSRDGQRVITAGADGVLKIWEIPLRGNTDKGDPDSWRINRRGHTGPVRCLAVSPVDDLLVTGGDDHTVRVWTLPAPPQPPPLPPPPPHNRDKDAGKG
jgi:WD40 repeat protein